MQERHEMTLAGHAESGTEEWFCSICGRRMQMRWEPEFHTLVFEFGDDTAVHYGTRGALRLDELVADQAK
jgi:hypothetical protein